MTDEMMKEEAAHMENNENVEEAHRKMSTSGTSLYELMGLEKGAPPEDVKRAYRRLALRYHPDKNRNDPDAGDKFKEISYANSILADETKKQIYDAYGSMGIHLSSQIGEENFSTYLLMTNKWVKAIFVGCGILTGCYCCCCCLFCCCCCCGKLGHKPDEDFNFNIPEEELDRKSREALDTNEGTPIIITEQPSPTYNSTDSAAPAPTVFAMPPPPPRSPTPVTTQPRPSPPPSTGPNDSQIDETESEGGSPVRHQEEELEMASSGGEGPPPNSEDASPGTKKVTDV